MIRFENGVLYRQNKSRRWGRVALLLYGAIPFGVFFFTMDWYRVHLLLDHLPKCGVCFGTTGSDWGSIISEFFTSQFALAMTPELTWHS